MGILHCVNHLCLNRAPGLGAFHLNQSIRWDQLASQFVPERIETTAVLAPFSGP